MFHAAAGGEHFTTLLQEQRGQAEAQEEQRRQAEAREEKLIQALTKGVTSTGAHLSLHQKVFRNLHHSMLP